jgi:hypothetical protein
MRINIPKEQRFLLEGNNPLNGVITYLMGKFGSRSAVNVSCNSCFSDRHEAKNAVALDNNFIFNWKGLPNQWIAFDFKSRTVVSTHYIFRSDSGKANNPSSWVFAGSNDGNRGNEARQATRKQRLDP